MAINLFRQKSQTDWLILVIEAFSIAFLIINFNQDFGLAFLGLAVTQIALMGLETARGGFAVNYSFLKDTLLKSVFYGITIFIVFAGVSIVLQQISFQSVLSLQSQRIPALQASIFTGNLAQSFLVPFVENMVFFAVGIEFILTYALNARISLGIIDKILSIIGTNKSELITALLVSSAFVLFHITAKISLGVPGIVSTFIFGMVQSYATMKLKSTAPGIFSHVINNILASGLLRI